MEILSKNITPSVSLPSGTCYPITMIKAAGGVPLFTNMKLVKDLGLQLMPNGVKNARYGIYECPFCGKHFRKLTTLITQGAIKSCGCYKKLFGTLKFKKHGMSRSEIYTHWIAMKQRCNDVNAASYPDYGGRGIIICAEWESNFKAFQLWAQTNGYKDGLYLDRERVNENYSPENCRWVTSLVNGQNKRLLDKRNKSGYRGVCLKDKRWIAQICWNRKPQHIGMFATPELAAQAYNDFVIAHGTEHPLNIIK